MPDAHAADAPVLVDARSLATARSGIGMFTTAIVGRWVAAGRPVRLLTVRGAAATTREVVPGAAVDELAAPFHLRALARARRLGARYFSPDSLIVPLLLGRAATVTVHDLAPLVHPDAHHRRGRLAHGLMLRRAATRAGAVVVPSEATRADLHRHAPGARVTVVPEAARELPAGGPLPAGVVPPYVLFAGTLEPRKHVVELAAAFLAAAPEPWTLVVAGGMGWLGEPARARLTELGRSPRVRLLGYVDDATLGALLSQAGLLAYPSSYEGFGLPVLEAMAAGTPVLTTTAAALAEVAGDAAVLLDLDGPDPYRSGLQDALASTLADEALRADLVAAGRERAARYSWDRAAEQVWRLIAGAPSG